MKAITKYIVLLLGLVLSASCDQLDYPDRFVQTSGKPRVDFIRYGDKDVMITQAAMAEVVCLVGDNLTSVHDIYFNDQQAVLNTSYITAKTLLVQVPRTMPVVTTDKLYLITRDSTVVDYDFKVLPPAPKIESLSNEWAAVGEEVVLKGSYLFAPLTIQFPGAEAIEIADGTDGSSVTVKVPAGAQPGKIKVTTSSGTAQSIFLYKDSRGMLFDFDGLTGLDNHGWNGHKSQDDDGTGVAGRFFQFGDGTAVLDGHWEENFYSLVYWPGSWNDPENYMDGDYYAPRLCDIVDFSNWQNMGLKFEMCIPAESPWTVVPMQIVVGGVDLISYGNADILDIFGNKVAGQNNTYMNDDVAPRVFYMPWKATGSFDTGGKWITVTIPLTDFNLGWSGASAKAEVSAETFASMWFFICNGDRTDLPEGECTPIIKIDNVRAVPIK